MNIYPLKKMPAEGCYDCEVFSSCARPPDCPLQEMPSKEEAHEFIEMEKAQEIAYQIKEGGEKP